MSWFLATIEINIHYLQKYANMRDKYISSNSRDRDRMGERQNKIEKRNWTIKRKRARNKIERETK